jgi:cytochrome oxidase assembly protein ShyY1
MSSEVKTKEPWSFFKSIVALGLVFLCLVAADWQYTRGVDRQARNNVIEERIARSPIELSSKDAVLDNNEWQSITTSGRFDSTQQILLRNRYWEGKYGYEVLTLFTNTSGEKFWVDRGWVKAGATATTPPEVTAVPTGDVSITGRFRLDSSLPRGSFFALPATGEGLVSELNAQSQLDTEKFYIDLLSGSEASLTPAAPAQLPPLSDGPHKAYALQWLFFGGLIVYGRILIRRTR